MKGTVKKWLPRGFGFIDPDEGDDDIFVHHSEVEGADELEVGQRLEFGVEDSDKGPKAVNVKLIQSE